jgi:hypothetical protein
MSLPGFHLCATSMSTSRARPSLTHGRAQYDEKELRLLSESSTPICLRGKKRSVVASPTDAGLTLPVRLLTELEKRHRICMNFPDDRLRDDASLVVGIAPNNRRRPVSSFCPRRERILFIISKEYVGLVLHSAG